ncbi:DNA cytosine methyltransferase [Stenotrophomonas muris]|uniref:DNA cytosine methyltransferase n=1 Tax=Stenotrophomonas muris TaxID=2963283 RepID=UPI00383AA7FF
MNYYSEWDPYAAQWIRNLIDAGLIPPGHVDTRSITDVQPSDLFGYRQCHFFAGIAGWSLAARLAGWPDDRELWSGSAPCQPFSVAGKGKAQDDDRHLWPYFLRLIRARRPAVVMGEQVAAAIGKNWLDGVSADLEAEDYACRAVVVPACAVDAPHRRDRLWFVAHANDLHAQGHFSGSTHPEERCFQSQRSAGSLRTGTGLAAHSNVAGGSVADPIGGGDRREAPAADHVGPQADRSSNWTGRRGDACGSAWAGAGWLIGHDGKARRVEPSIRLLAHGIPARVGKLRAGGNAIVPEVAAEVIGAYMDCCPEIV